MAKKDRWRRPSRKLAQEKRFLVVVEGIVIEAVKRSRQMRSVEVVIETGHTDPIGIVNQAKARRKEACKTERFDQVWCVFDTEAKRTQRCREGLREAINSADHAQGALSHLQYQIHVLSCGYGYMNTIKMDGLLVTIFKQDVRALLTSISSESVNC